MKFLLSTGLLVLAMQLSTTAQSTEEKRESLSAVIRDWIELNRQIEETERNWQEDKRILEAYRDNLKQQIESYQADLKDEAPYTEQREEVLKQRRSDEAALESARKHFIQKLPDLEAKALGVAKLFPPIVAETSTVRQAIDKLEAEAKLRGSEDYKPDHELNNRLVSVLNILREAEKFQNKITVKAEGGDEATSDTLYFGLGQAYRVARTGKQAWIGRVKDGQFTFIPADEHADAIRELIEIANDNRDAGMIAVPTQIQ